MSYYGDIRLGDTIDVKFTTRQISGAPSTLSGTPVISAYVGNGTTEITAGITLTVDFDSRTGLNNVRVVATSGNGFATATNVQLVITTGTVNSVSVVGEVIGSFSIECRSALMPTTAGRTLVVDAAGLADANTVKVGPTGSGTAQTAGDIIGDTNDIQTRLPAALVSGRMDSSVGAMAANTLTAAAAAADFGAEMATAVWTDTTAGDFTVALSVGKSVMNGVSLGTGLTVAAVSGAVGSVTGAVGSVTGNVGGNVTGSVGSVTGITASDVGAIKAKTDNLPAAPAAVGDIPTAVQNADALLGRNVAGGSSAGRLVKEALYVLRNKTEIGAGTLTVYEVDDTTSAFTAAVTTTAGNPISAIDPA